LPLLTENGRDTPPLWGTRIVPLQVKAQLPPVFKACWTAAAVHDVMSDTAPAGDAPITSPPATSGNAAIVDTRIRCGQRCVRTVAFLIVLSLLRLPWGDVSDGVIATDRSSQRPCFQGGDNIA
jgi:hypothetical protein